MQMCSLCWGPWASLDLGRCVDWDLMGVVLSVLAGAAKESFPWHSGQVKKSAGPQDAYQAAASWVG